MALVVRVDGVNQLRKVAAALKQASNGAELKREMLRNLRAAAQPAVKAAENAARAELPKSGGLNEFVASSKFAVRTRAAPKGASIRIVGTKQGHDLVALNKGIARHPVYGHNDRKWSVTFVPAGWWDRAMKPLAPKVGKALRKVMNDISNRIARRAS